MKAKELFVAKGDFLVSNLTYEGTFGNNNTSVGRKVLSLDGKFEGLLDEDGESMWLVEEASLVVIS